MRKYFFVLVAVTLLVVALAAGPLRDRHGDELRRLGRCLKGDATACQVVHLSR